MRCYFQIKLAPLCRPHKPADCVEQERIEKAGGQVFIANDTIVQTCINKNCYCLTSSRALGRFDLKNRDNLSRLETFNGSQKFYNHPIGNVPDVKFVDLLPNDEFIVIGSRDFLNKIPAEEVARSVKQGFCDDKNLDQIAAELIHKAQSSSTLQQRDHLDDMSVVIITAGDEKLLKTR